MGQLQETVLLKGQGMECDLCTKFIEPCNYFDRIPDCCSYLSKLVSFIERKKMGVCSIWYTGNCGLAFMKNAKS